MITLRTFLKDPEGQFVPLVDYAARPENPRYVEGAVELVIDGTTLIGISAWDDVNWLWGYLIGMATRLRAGADEASTYFPSQPIKLVFQREGGQVRVSREDANHRLTATVDEGELMATLEREGRAFWAKMGQLVPEEMSSYQQNLDAINQL